MLEFSLINVYLQKCSYHNQPVNKDLKMIGGIQKLGANNIQGEVSIKE